MTDIVVITLDNEMDLVMCHKHSMKLAELAGLSLSFQTSFATAVSEISRCAIGTGKNSFLKLGVEKLDNQYGLCAIVYDENSLEKYKKGITYAKRLVNDIQVNELGDKIEITLTCRSKSYRFSEARVSEWADQFRNELAVSPYEEIKRKSEQLQKLSVKLKEGETYHRQLLQSLPVAVYTCDEKGFLQVYNRAAVELWGRVPQVGKTRWCGSYKATFMDGTPVTDDNCSMAITVKTGQVVNGQEKIIERTDGSKRIVHPYPQPLFNSAGHVIGGVNVMIDITEQKKAAQELQEGEERLRLATEAAELGTWDFDLLTGEFLSSERHQQIIGYESQSNNHHGWNKERILEYVHPLQKENAEQAFLDALKTGRLSYEAQVVKPDGSMCWVEVNGTTFYDKKNIPVRMLGTTHDITKEKTIHQELKDAKIASEEALKFKEQFLANMSHEIRTPMNAIVGFTDLILKTDLGPDQKQFVDAIKTSGENLLVIINDILDFSRLQAGGFYFEKIDFKITQLMGTLTDLLLPKSVEKGIKLSVIMAENIPDGLIGDPTRLNQILLNLVGNAIKFTETGEVVIRMTVLKEDAKTIELQFSVKDTGIGIPKNKMKSIFEVFMQATNETTRKYGGSGLGLSIVKQLVEHQGGKITAISKENVGSTFSFNLVFGKSQKTKVKELVEKTEDLPTIGALKVLLVEDNKLNQVLAKTVILSWGWQVELAENGLIALDKLEEQDFDIVLMDIQLPEMDGYEAARTIRSKFTDTKKRFVPIIALTAHAMPSEEKKCFIAGMNGYISKPFTPRVLYAKIVSVINDSKKGQKTSSL